MGETNWRLALRAGRLACGIPPKGSIPTFRATDTVRALALSTTSALLASGSADTVRLWTLPTLECTFLFDHLSHRVASLAFSQCGNFLAIADFGWDMFGYDKPVRLKKLSDHYCIDWEDRTDITIQQVSADRKLTPVLNSLSKLCIHSFKWQGGQILGIAISLSGQRVAAIPIDGVATYWDLKTGETHLLEPEPSKCYRRCLSFCGEDRLVALEEHAKIIVWDLGAGGGHTMMGPISWLSGGIIASSYSQILVSPHADGMLSVWDVAETRPEKNHTVVHYPLDRLCFLSDGRLVSVSATTARIWDTPALEMKNEFRYSEDPNEYHEVSPAGLLVSGHNSTISVLDLATGASWQCSLIHEDPITLLKFGLNGLLASGCVNGLVCVWNIQTGRPLHQFNIPPGGICYVDAFLNDDFLAVSDIKGRIFVWELSTGVCHLLRGHTESVTFGLSENGRFASCDNSGNARIWSCTTWACEVALSPVVSTVDFWLLDRQLVITQEQIYRVTRDLVFIQDLKSEERSRVWNIDLKDPIILAALKRESLWFCETDGQGNWIKYGGQRLLRLPDYGRVIDRQVAGNTIAVGYAGGRITLIQFDLEKMQSAFASACSSISDIEEE
jgi:WD40 repeat protein